MEISYFEMAEEDIPCIAAMEQQFFSQPWKEESIGHYMEAGNTLFLVAKDPQKNIVGYLALMCILDEADLVSIAVDEDFRNMGIAREMLDIAYETAAESGIVKIHLEVRESNLPAIKLYESEGFVKDGIRKDFYDKPKENAILYTRLIGEDEC